MRKSTPVEELGIKELANNLNEIHEKMETDKREEDRNHNIEEIKYISLESIANNKNGIEYRPYLVDFGFIMDRIKNDYKVDRGLESVRIKTDIANQLAKMKSVPPFSTECHIESRYGLLCTNIKSFVLKNIFRQKEYRLIFHGRDATFKEKYCKVDFKQFLYVSMALIFICVLSCKFSIMPLFVLSIVLEIIIFFIMIIIG